MCSVQWFDSLIPASAPLVLGCFFCSYKVMCSYRNLICTDINLLLGLKTHNPILCSIHTFSAIIFCSSQIWMTPTFSIPVFFPHSLTPSCPPKYITSALFLQLSALWVSAISRKVSSAIDHT